MVIANQNNVRYMYSVTTSYFSNLIVQKVNKVLVYITDLTATLNLWHFDLHCFLVYMITYIQMITYHGPQPS